MQKLFLNACVAALLLGPQLFGQTVGRERSESNDPSRNRYPSTGMSELAKENLSHVAASAVQIREVLVKDAGLLVELKRCVAQEAADNG